MSMNKRKVLTMTFALVCIMATWAYDEKSIPENHFTYGFISGSCKVIGGSPNNEAGIIDIPQYYYEYTYSGDELYYPVREIGSGAFAGNNDIKKVVCRAYQLTYITGSGRAGSSEGLTSCSSSYVSIGSFAFKNCVNLESISFPKSLQSIGEDAFSGCSNLTSITLPTAVKTIGHRAFEGCSSLMSVTVNNKIPISISIDVFSNCGDMTLFVPAGCKEVYESAAGWRNFKEIKEMNYTTIHIPEGQNNIRTFSCFEALDFTNITDIKAYIVDVNRKVLCEFEDEYGYGFTYHPISSLSNGILGFKRVFQVAPGQGVLIKGQPGDYQIPSLVDAVISEEVDPKGYLVGVPYDTIVAPNEDRYVNYILTKNGFRKLSHEGTIVGGKAYLHFKGYVGGTGAKDGLSISLGDDDETGTVLGVKQIKDDTFKMKDEVDVWYSLSGLLLNGAPTSKGIYIKNGKKINVK